MIVEVRGASSERRLLGVRRLVAALARGGLTPRCHATKSCALHRACSERVLRQVAAGQSADNRGPRRGSRAGVAWRRTPRGHSKLN
jgi:hypothetical protein